MLYEIFTIGNIEWKFMRRYRCLLLYTMFNLTNAMSFPMQSQTPSSDTGGVSVKVFFSSHLYFDGLVVLPGGTPYPRMDGRKVANLLQDGYRMPKPQLWMKTCKFYFSTRSLPSYKETFIKSLTDHLNNTRYEIMMKCWKNDPHARPTFTKLKNQLKDMETQHKVRILINMTFFSRKTDWLRFS